MKKKIIIGDSIIQISKKKIVKIISENRSRCKYLYDYLPLENLTILENTKDMKNDRQTISFKAQEISLFSTYFKSKKILLYSDAKQLFIDLQHLIEKLKNHNYGIPHLAMDDILVIKTIDKISEEINISFMFLNINKVHTIYNDEFIIELPVDEINTFCVPNLMNLKTLPQKVHYKSSFYAICIFIISCLTGEKLNIISVNYETLKNKIDFILETKLYWALLRGIYTEPDERFLLFI